MLWAHTQSAVSRQSLTQPQLCHGDRRKQAPRGPHDTQLPFSPLPSCFSPVPTHSTHSSRLSLSSTPWRPPSLRTPRLDVRCSRNLATYDLETEVFLHVLHNCVEYVHGPEHRWG